MKRWLAVIIIFFMALNFAGCASWQKKFTRKKKAEAKRPRIYQLKKYKKTPSPELYKKHYAYWMTWQSELLSDLGKSHKKDMRCIEEILGNLYDMQNILIPEKADQLKSHIDRLLEVKDTIFREELSQYNRHYIRNELDREDRTIKREFCYAKVKDCLRKNFDDERRQN